MTFLLLALFAAPAAEISFEGCCRPYQRESQSRRGVPAARPQCVKRARDSVGVATGLWRCLRWQQSLQL